MAQTLRGDLTSEQEADLMDLLEEKVSVGGVVPDSFSGREKTATAAAGQNRQRPRYSRPIFDAVWSVSHECNRSGVLLVATFRYRTDPHYSETGIEYDPRLAISSQPATFTPWYFDFAHCQRNRRVSD